MVEEKTCRNDDKRSVSRRYVLLGNKVTVMVTYLLKNEPDLISAAASYEFKNKNVITKTIDSILSASNSDFFHRSLNYKHCVRRPSGKWSFKSYAMEFCIFCAVFTLEVRTNNGFVFALISRIKPNVGI